MQAYVRAFHHVYEEQMKVLLSESRVVLQHGRSTDVKKSAGFKFSTSTADVRSTVAGSMTSLSPARGNASQSIADFGGSPALSMASQESLRGPM